MRSANASTNESATTTEQDRRKDTRVRVLVCFRPESSADAKTDKSSDQCMASVAWLPPHSSVAPPPRIPHLGRKQREWTALGKFRKWLVAAAAACKVGVLRVWNARSKDLFCRWAVVCSLCLSGLCPGARQCSQCQQKRDE